MAKTLPPELIRFLRAHVRSVWALELLLLLLKRPERELTIDELVREMRATGPLVSGLLQQFHRAGLVSSAEGQAWRWNPSSAEVDAQARQLAATYAEMPFAVMQAIAEGPGPSVMDFADAFRFRGDR